MFNNTRPNEKTLNSATFTLINETIFLFFLFFCNGCHYFLNRNWQPYRTDALKSVKLVPFWFLIKNFFIFIYYFLLLTIFTFWWSFWTQCMSYLHIAFQNTIYIQQHALAVCSVKFSQLVKNEAIFSFLTLIFKLKLIQKMLWKNHKKNHELLIWIKFCHKTNRLNLSLK